MRDNDRREGPTAALLSIDDVSRILNCGRTFAWQLTASGRLPTVRLGRLLRVRRIDLDAYVDSLVTPVA